jgi:hypothetical protein
MKEKPETSALKLFVVGERSGDPNDWGQWTTKALVIASSAEEALRLTDRDPRGPVSELKLTTACVLMAD